MLGQIKSDYIMLVQGISGYARLNHVLSDYVNIIQVMRSKFREVQLKNDMIV